MNLLLAQGANGELVVVHATEPVRAPDGHPQSWPEPSVRDAERRAVEIQVLDALQKPIGELAFPTERYVFVDTPISGTDRLAGGVRRASASAHDVVLPPLPTAAVQLRFRQTALGGAAGEWSAPPWPIPTTPFRTDGGLKARVVPLNESTAEEPRDAFNIVILAEGFQAKELKVFRRLAEVAAKAIIGEPSFAGLAEHINIWSVSTRSKDSGVGNSPYEGVTKDTALQVEGFFKVDDMPESGPAYFGTQHHERVRFAAELVGVPWNLVDLAVVLVNSAIKGGSGDPTRRTAYVPIGSDERLFSSSLLHESGHAICGLTDEYPSPTNRPSGFHAPNLATEKQRRERSVPWRDLLHDFETTLDGDFRAQHVLGDPMAGDNPVMPCSLDGMLGLFWGCCFVEGSATDARLDPDFERRGGGYYRPMARCKMRKLSEPFCRVCANELRMAVVNRQRRRATYVADGNLRKGC